MLLQEQSGLYLAYSEARSRGRREGESKSLIVYVKGGNWKQASITSCYNIVLCSKLSSYIRGFTKFGIKVLWRLQFLEYLRTLRLKFQKARTKTGVFLGHWDSQLGRPRKTPILVQAFWNFKLKVLKYPRNCRLHATLIQKGFSKILNRLIYILV